MTQRLHANIAGESPGLRQASLELLATGSPVLERCREVDRMPLTFHLARERCVRIRKIAPAVRDAEEAILAVRYLVGALSIWTCRMSRGFNI